MVMLKKTTLLLKGDSRWLIKNLRASDENLGLLFFRLKNLAYNEKGGNQNGISRRV